MAEHLLVKCLARVNRVGKEVPGENKDIIIMFFPQKIKIFLPTMLGLEFLFHGIV